MSRFHELGKFTLQTFDERALSAAGDNSYLDAFALQQGHEVEHARHNLGGGQQPKLACLLVVHAQSFLVADVDAALCLHQLLDGVGAALTFGHVGVRLGHRDAECAHGPLPGNGMVGHGVVAYTVHVEQRSLHLHPLADDSASFIVHSWLVHRQIFIFHLSLITS